MAQESIKASWLENFVGVAGVRISYEPWLTFPRDVWSVLQHWQGCGFSIAFKAETLTTLNVRFEDEMSVSWTPTDLTIAYPESCFETEAFVSAIDRLRRIEKVVDGIGTFLPSASIDFIMVSARVACSAQQRPCTISKALDALETALSPEFNVVQVNTEVTVKVGPNRMLAFEAGSQEELLEVRVGTRYQRKSLEMLEDVVRDAIEGSLVAIESLTQREE